MNTVEIWEYEYSQLSFLAKISSLDTPKKLKNTRSPNDTAIGKYNVGDPTSSIPFDFSSATLVVLVL